jgi:large subunit ribosomal protein L29
MKTEEDLKSLSESDILVRRAEVMRDMMVSQFQLHTGQMEDSSQLKKMRRRLARLNTELRAREIAANMPKGSYLNRTIARVGGEQPVIPAGEAAATPRKSRFGLGFLRDTLLGKRFK